MNEQVSSPVAMEKRFQMLVEAVTDYAIYMIDADGRVSSWNRGAERIKGYRAEDVLGRHFSMFFTPEDRDAGLPARALATAARSGRFEQEGWRLRKDGTRFWALAVLDAIHDDTGKLVGFAKITRDMTERRAAQQAVEESERRFRLLVQSVIDYAIFMLDPHGRVTNWNSGAQRMKGYGADEIVGAHFSTFYTEEDRRVGLPAQALEKARREGRFETEGWRVRKDGGRFWASVVIDPIHDEQGQLIGFAKITRDITEQRDAQRKLAETREQLFQAQKMEAIGQLTGGIAHDFNNLLTIVLGGTDMAERLVGDNDKLKRILGNIRHAVKRGEALTKQLLAFSRRQTLKPQIIDVHEQIRVITDLLGRSLRADIEIITDVAPSVAPIEVDASQLELAILNVGLNARDAMPQGGTLRISAHHASPRQDGDPRDCVAVAITDTGIGIPEEIKHRVIEPFFTTKAVGKGSGLGLSQAYGFAAQSGGLMTIDSTVGIGTTVTFYLPVAKSLPAKPAKPDETTRISGRGTILVVEDDPGIAELAVSLLEDAGYTARLVTTAHSALEELARNGVDALFSDIMLPGGMNGAELAHLVRANFPDVGIVLATGFAESATSILAKDFALVSKPYDQHALVGALAKVLHRAH
jgi:PAS domain S-box-containing protein